MTDIKIATWCLGTYLVTLPPYLVHSRLRPHMGKRHITSTRLTAAPPSLPRGVVIFARYGEGAERSDQGREGEGREPPSHGPTSTNGEERGTESCHGSCTPVPAAGADALRRWRPIHGSRSRYLGTGCVPVLLAPA